MDEMLRLACKWSGLYVMSVYGSENEWDWRLVQSNDESPISTREWTREGESGTQTDSENGSESMKMSRKRCSMVLY